VHRHRVRRKGVERQQVERTVPFMGKTEPRIAQPDRRPGQTAAQIGELTGIAGETDDRRIDLVEAP